MTGLRRWAPLAAASLMLVVAAPASTAVCTVTAQGVTFGAYDTLSASPTEGVGNVQVNCDSATSFTVSLGAGNGSFAQRVLSGGADQLDYNLFTDAARTIVWGDGLGATGNLSSSGTLVDLPVYGRIPAQQNVPATNYVDTITITVSY